MLFSAIIETLDYATYTCTVQIPDLQSVGDLGPVVRTACIAEMPGLQNSFKVGDIVWVAFVRGEKQYPVVIGKVTNPKNSGLPGGALNVESLNISNSAALPGTLTFNGIEADYDKDSSYWAFTKDGESLMTGVDGEKIEADARYELTYTK